MNPGRMNSCFDAAVRGLIAQPLDEGREELQDVQGRVGDESRTLQARTQQEQAETATPESKKPGTGQ